MYFSLLTAWRLAGQRLMFLPSTFLMVGWFRT